MSPSGMLLLSHCMQSSLLSLWNSPSPCANGVWVLGNFVHGIKGRKQRLSEFATFPIIQMILNANYPPWLYRERPVTQNVACLCRALSQRVSRWRSRRLLYSSTCCRTATAVTQNSTMLCVYTKQRSSVQYGVLHLSVPFSLITRSSLGVKINCQ